ncbi:FERM domain-containing protein 8 [Frankliniella fusca]|uniref:FERM domain-containing protein 8 n=1 Tax=Frankliniella fusca TaxID=407009 RepID=A0AAE1L7A9_9NEOP|nr:FERM domain-containing protein 8 [Frankliniella fusca]
MDSHSQADGSHSYITVIPVDYSRGRGYSQQSSDYLDQYVDYFSDSARDEYIRGDYNINSDPQYDKLGGIYAPPGYEREKTHSHVTIDREALERDGLERDRVRDRSQLAQMGDAEWERDRERERTQHRHIQHERSERDRWQHTYIPSNTIDREREREREREQREKEREGEWERERAAHMVNKAQPTPDSCMLGMGGIKENSNSMHNETNMEKVALQPFSNLGSRGAPLCVYLMSRIALHMELEDRDSTTTAELMTAIFQEDELGLPSSAGPLFSLWMCSGLLELQLKPHHKPFEIRRQWPLFLNQYCSVTESRIERDEPILSFQRNVFFPRREEEKIKDHKCLTLLFEEARYNILEGRYPCEMSHYLMLGGIQARIELGPYKQEEHTTQYFREHKDKFLPAHVRRTSWSWLPISGKNSPEVRLLEHYKRIPNNMSDRRLIRKYLEFCWSLPYYGSAFFQGQIEQPVRGLTSLITHQDIPVLVAINSQGVYVIDDIQCVVLLGLKFEELSWEFAKPSPSQENNSNCLPCLFLQFMVVENGARVSKILQVFSKQAIMMDALISVFVDEKRRTTAATYHDETDRPVYDTATDSDDTQIPLTMMSRRELPQSCISNKLSRLTLATFDEEESNFEAMETSFCNTPYQDANDYDSDSLIDSVFSASNKLIY